MKIALAQIDTTVGDFAGNAEQVRRRSVEARELGAELVVFPELTLCGYSAKDHLDDPAFIAAARETLTQLATPAEWNAGIGVIVGFPESHRQGPGPRLHNACALIDDGRITAIARKVLLPYYDVFDERRYFEPGESVTAVPFRGVTLGLSICEDIWNDARFWPVRRYERDPIAELVAAGADVIVNVAASPFHVGKPALRSRMLAATASHHGVQVVAVNLVGGNDSLVFDGNSEAIAADGQAVVRCAAFAEDLQVFDTGDARGAVPPLPEGDDAEGDEILDALVTGLAGYFRKTGFSRAVLGLSGGMDSALVACLAAEALGPEHVLGVLMPSRFTSDASNEDARALAQNLGIATRVIPIEGPFEAILEALEPAFEGRAPDITEENLQARIRGLYLMALSNKLGHLLLATGNKSELAVGYATLYGDMCGGLAPLADVLKTRVYRVAARFNARRGAEVIPQGIFDKAPSAELRADQTDEDSLPAYALLDQVVAAYVEERLPAERIAERGIDRAVVDEVLRLMVRAEYKRRQAAPGLKVSPRMFGESWRMPLAQGYHPWRPKR